MNLSQLSLGVAGVVAAIVLFSVVLVPTVYSATSETLTIYNEGPRYAEVSEGEECNITITDHIEVDGVAINSVDFPLGRFTLVYGAHSALLYTPNEHKLQFAGTFSQSSSGQMSNIGIASVSNPIQLYISGATMTISINGEVDKIVTDNWAYLNGSGEYALSMSPYVLADSKIIGAGVTYSPFSSATAICFTGTSESITAGVYRSTPVVTIDSYEINSTEVCSNLLKINSIVFHCTQSDEAKNATYTYFLAPYEIIYENPDYHEGVHLTLIEIIPVLILVGLMSVAIRVFISRQD